MRKGLDGASEVVVWPETVPEIVGATAGSVSITLVALSTTGAPPALLRSLSVNVVVEDALGAPALRREDEGVEFAGDRRRGS